MKRLAGHGIPCPEAEFQSHFKLLLLDHLRYAEVGFVTHEDCTVARPLSEILQGRAKDLQAEAQKAVASQELRA